MAHLITLPIHAPPDTVNVLVNFYDDQERDLLLASPMSKLLQGLPTTLTLATPDLCAYYLYYKKAPRRRWLFEYRRHRPEMVYCSR